jgi:hypothetical protein
MRGTNNEYIPSTLDDNIKAPDITGRHSCNSVLISSVMCFITPKNVLTQGRKEKNIKNVRSFEAMTLYIYIHTHTHTHIIFVCDTFIRRLHEFVCGGEAITDRKRQNYSSSACISELVVSVDFYFTLYLTYVPILDKFNYSKHPNTQLLHKSHVCTL